MSERTTTRRRLLETAGSIGALGLAGCLGSSEPTGSGGADAPTATATPTPNPTEGETEKHHEPDEHHEGEDETAHGEGGHGGEGAADHVEVEMLSNDSGHHFHPHVAWVEPGGAVTFRNVSGAHSVAAYHPDNGKPLRIPEDAASFDSGLLNGEGQTFEHTFEGEGVYDVYCAPHEALGMIGTVLVGKPDPHGQPGLADPGDGLPETAAMKVDDLNHQVDDTLEHTHGEETPTETEHSH
ncbi:MAG: plastocyanin/azurin family copper-binding protein [Haloarculaceae archaeon]